MATAESFVTDSLKDIGVWSSETPIIDGEMDDGIVKLNDIMFQLMEEGFDLGFTEIADKTDEVTIPKYSNIFVKGMLSVHLLPSYSITKVPTAMADTVKNARMAVVRTLNSKILGQEGTYQNMIFSVIETIGAKKSLYPVSEQQIKNGIIALNDIVTELESSKMSFNYTINSTGDIEEEHGIPDWAFKYFKDELAVQLAPQYDVEVTTVMLRKAKKGLNNIRKRMRGDLTTELPDGMPLGGRRCGAYSNVKRVRRDEMIDGQGDIMNDGDGDTMITGRDNGQ